MTNLLNFYDYCTDWQNNTFGFWFYRGFIGDSNPIRLPNLRLPATYRILRFG